MDKLGNIISAVIVLLIVIAVYIVISYLREKKLGDGSGGCNGNCASCSMHANGCSDKDEKKTRNKK